MITRGAAVLPVSGVPVGRKDFGRLRRRPILCGITFVYDEFYRALRWFLGKLRGRTIEVSNTKDGIVLAALLRRS